MFSICLRGWAFGSTFYTLFDVTTRLCHLYPGISNSIMIAGIIINIIINFIFLTYFSEH